jgi:1-acyl-sn-glycerol-3-phosphate acyltransferase
VQNIIIDKPYRFVPPHRGRFWAKILQGRMHAYLKKNYGIESHDIRHAERLTQSLQAGRGILLAPNHCRPCDPFVLGLLGREVGALFYVMASGHLFMQGRLQRWLLRRAGAFSVYREGLDRDAVKAAIDILQRAERPLIIFPEGYISRSNDRIGNLMEGTAFLARSAAKQHPTIVHPIAIKYFFLGNVQEAVGPVLDDIERRLSWQPQRSLPLVDRIIKVGEALLSLKEIEYWGRAQSGTIAERLARLIDHVLEPLEREWLQGKRDSEVWARIKRLRTAILPDLVAGEISEEERTRRWRQLADLYFVQQMACYPPDYIASRPTRERVLETVERFEEDLTDVARIHRPMRVVIQVGEAIEVNKEKSDTLMPQVKQQLESMIQDIGKDAVMA